MDSPDGLVIPNGSRIPMNLSPIVRVRSCSQLGRSRRSLMVQFCMQVLDGPTCEVPRGATSERHWPEYLDPLRKSIEFYWQHNDIRLQHPGRPSISPPIDGKPRRFSIANSCFVVILIASLSSHRPSHMQSSQITAIDLFET